VRDLCQYHSRLATIRKLKLDLKSLLFVLLEYTSLFRVGTTDEQKASSCINQIDRVVGSLPG